MTTEKNIKRSEAAKKSNEKRSQLPSFGTQDPREIIERLEADGQPWILMRYPYNLAFAPDIKGVCYEIVIWQTCESDQSYGTFDVDAKTAREIIEEYGLTERKRYEKEGCIIWAANERLSKLHKAYMNRVERYRARAKLARSLYYAIGECEWVFGKEEYKSLRKRALEAEQGSLLAIPKYEEYYLKANNIIIYNI